MSDEPRCDGTSWAFTACEEDRLTPVEMEFKDPLEFLDPDPPLPPPPPSPKGVGLAFNLFMYVGMGLLLWSTWRMTGELLRVLFGVQP